LLWPKTLVLDNFPIVTPVGGAEWEMLERVQSRVFEMPMKPANKRGGRSNPSLQRIPLPQLNPLFGFLLLSLYGSFMKADDAFKTNSGAIAHAQP
jgi:hypothetical protein